MVVIRLYTFVKRIIKTKIFKVLFIDNSRKIFSNYQNKMNRNTEN